MCWVEDRRWTLLLPSCKAPPSILRGMKNQIRTISDQMLPNFKPALQSSKDLQHIYNFKHMEISDTTTNISKTHHSEDKKIILLSNTTKGYNTPRKENVQDKEKKLVQSNRGDLRQETIKSHHARLLCIKPNYSLTNKAGGVGNFLGKW